MFEEITYGVPIPFIVAVFATFVVFAILGIGVMEAVSRRQRLRSLIDRRHKRHTLGSEPGSRSAKVLLFTVMKAVVARFNLFKEQQVRTIKGELYRAGYRSRDAIVVYAFLKIFLPVVAAGAGLLGLSLYAGLSLSLTVTTLVVLVSALAGSYLPDFFLRRQAAKRRAAILAALPDALDLLVICVESGLSLDAALDRVAGQVSRASPELGDELTYTGLELRFLPQRRTALDNLVARVDLASTRALVNTLTQSEKYGTPLAKALRTLAAEQRKERMLRAEEKAARLPATMTIPLIAFILPALFVVLLGPAVLGIVETLMK